MKPRDQAEWIVLVVLIILASICGYFCIDYWEQKETIAALEERVRQQEGAKNRCSGSGVEVTCPICGKFDYRQIPHDWSGGADTITPRLGKTSGLPMTITREWGAYRIYDDSIVLDSFPVKR